MDKFKTVMLFFVASESFFFLALIISYVVYSHPGGKLSDTASYLDIAKTSVFTLFLLSSSLTVHMAGNRVKQGKRKGIVIWLALTIILGAIFLGGQLTEYAGLIRENVTISQNVFGSAFFTLTGFHGLHVFIGLIILGIITGMIYSGKFKKLESTALDSASIYWHFVDAVWIVVFSVVYIGAII
jgi:cytochrome c oxidase subunit III